LASEPLGGRPPPVRPARVYQIELTARAVKALAALPRDAQRLIGRRIDALALEPRPPGVEKLKGSGSLFRVRSGDYRIVYTIEDRVLVIVVVRVAHRREVYRGL
jgi:mRNA interferase RelE/StbE